MLETSTAQQPTSLNIHNTLNRKPRAPSLLLLLSTTSPLLPLESLQTPPLHARFNPRNHRHRTAAGRRNLLSIMRIALGALGLTSLCVYWFSHNLARSGIEDGVDVSHPREEVVVELLRNHEPMLAGPVDRETTKYFHEPAGHEPGDDSLLGHYDIRYFSGHALSYASRTDTLHHMIRAYLSSLRALNLETWIAHGTLLGWWWNGEILPWDWDLDVQVSASTLAYMAKWLNGTFHSYRSGDVERTYLLDVNPWSSERENGDGMNIIDARWIDVRNGLFVDITGVARLEPAGKPRTWTCKNYHNYSEVDIWPVRESWFEGVRALVPAGYGKVLEDEYGVGAFSSEEFEGHHWDENLKKWIADKTVPQQSRAIQKQLLDDEKT